MGLPHRAGPQISSETVLRGNIKFNATTILRLHPVTDLQTEYNKGYAPISHRPCSLKSEICLDNEWSGIGQLAG